LDPRDLGFEHWTPTTTKVYSSPVQVRASQTVGNRTTYTQARANLAKLCDEVAESCEPYVIERRNGENVALISESELDSLLETAHLLRSPRNARRLVTALERALGGEHEPTSLEELRREHGLDGEAT
jgi:antitoxin YefM